MEKRHGNIIIHASGGTAAKGACTYKLTLPSAWMHEMGITGQSRHVELSFDGSTITISKHLPVEEWIAGIQAQGHSLLRLFFYDGNTLCTTILADPASHTLRIENHVDSVLKTAFGNNLTPSWADFQQLLESRCIPRTRAGLREYLDAIGIAEYDPLEIIKKTQGRMAEDNQWISMEVLA